MNLLVVLRWKGNALSSLVFILFRHVIISQSLTADSSLPNPKNFLFSFPNFWLAKLRLNIMLKNQRKLKAFTLTELLVVLGIVGILTLLALPIFDNLGAKAYEAEAEMQLKHIKGLLESNKIRTFQYSGDLKEIGFTAPKLKKDGGTSVFEYSIVEASKTSFIVLAKAAEDFDGDGTYMEMTINCKSSA